jgi:hypothetical protein
MLTILRGEVNFNNILIMALNTILMLVVIKAAFRTGVRAFPVKFDYTNGGHFYRWIRSELGTRTLGPWLETDMLSS